MKILLVIGAFVMTAIAGFGQQELTPARALQLGRKYTAALYANDAATLWPAMSDLMKISIKSPADLRLANDKVRKQIGKETKMLKDRVMPNQQFLMYTRLAEFEKVPVLVVVTFTFSRQGKVEGFFVTQNANPAESKYLAYKNRTTFALPFSGQWTVFQGGRSVFDNYHAASPDQRFAYDFMVIKNAYQYTNKGWELTDFYSYGLPVLAPGAGTIVAAVDEFDDNSPLKPNKDAPPQGNSVVIDHGDGEFSMLAHLKRGSVEVKAGDKVVAGQQIGECGNSGNSPIPHLHYHLQTTSVWFKGEGLPIQFHDYISNGKPVLSGEPARGEVLQPK